MAENDPVKKAVEEVMTAFEEFKTTNDARLQQIETKGVADPVTVEKLARIEATIAKHEDLNAAITASTAESKAAKARADDLAEDVKQLELRIKRPGNDNKDVTAYKANANAWIRGVVQAHTLGLANLPEAQRKAIEQPEAEYKALGISNDTGVGYLAPVDISTEIIKGITLISQVRSLVRVRQTSLKAFQTPKRTAQPTAQWTADQGTRTETTGLAYGNEEIPTHEMYALIDISHQGLEDAAVDMEAEIRSEIDLQFAVAEGAAVVSGNGVGRPQGWLTSTDVSTTNSGAALVATADGMLTLKYALKSGYGRNANWALNRQTMGSVRKMKNGEGDYLWIPGIATGQPNTIDGDPYVEVPDMPNEGAGLKPITYGDFSLAYLLIDRIQMNMLRDPYTQATSGNIRFLMYRRIGGQVVLAEAIRTLVCSA
jgi:HK97 family phage major capsid protein